jgi:hypothetical protein
VYKGFKKKETNTSEIEAQGWYEECEYIVWQ